MKDNNRPGQQLKGLSVQELLGVTNEESAMEIDIRLIHPFKDHPFKVIDDEKMQDLVESIKLNGVLSPVLLREAGHGQYEMISGHRRMHAAQLAGLEAIPAFIRDMTDDEANMVLIYLGVMFGEAQAAIALKEIAKHLAGVALKQIPKVAITKVVGYSTLKSLLRIVGVKLTKDVAAKTAAKVIPLLGGVASGGLTFATLKIMSKRLYDKLAESRFTNKEIE